MSFIVIMGRMHLGSLDFTPLSGHLDLVAKPVRQHASQGADGIWVAEIDPALADTAAFCERYGVSMGQSANCIILEASRADRSWFAACLILATMRADVNGVIRKHLDARKISFASMEHATALTGMEFGGITPIGLPASWPILIDQEVMNARRVVIGSGLRSSKLLADSRVLSALAGAVVMPLAKN